MKAHDIFFGGDDKLRSGWRFAIFVTAYFAATIFIVPIAVGVIYALQLQGGKAFLISSVASLIPAVVIGWLCGKYLERLPFGALGMSFTGGWLRHLLIGFVLGAITLCVPIGIAALFGGISFAVNESGPGQIVRTLIVSFVVFAVAAAFEEVLFRGYILQTFARSGLAWLAILITSVVFGIVHLNNPNANWLGAINTALAGVWFGIGYLKTRDLWFVWGMHLIWNWMQGSIFGIEVSGLTDLAMAPLLKEIDAGPDWLTGGNYGIEASVACTIALIASTIAIHFMPGLKPSEEMMELQKPDRKRGLKKMD
jgi:membrane protease YdiL (CAAX protease family)